MCADDCCWPEIDWLFTPLFTISFFGIYFPSLLRANHSIINETDVFLRNEEWRRSWGCGRKGKGRLGIGNDLDNIITKDTKVDMVLCRNSSLPDLALILETWGDTCTLQSNDCCINYPGCIWGILRIEKVVSRRKSMDRNKGIISNWCSVQEFFSWANVLKGLPQFLFY